MLHGQKNILKPDDININMDYWNDEDFLKVVSESTTMSNVLRVFGIPYNQGHYAKEFHVRIKYLKANIDHFTLSKRSKQRPFEEILVKNSPYLGGSNYLKKRLVKAGLLEYKCKICDIKSWNDKPISLHLDHINGDSSDNRLENLRILCPNCHSQTETYCGSKKKKAKNTYKKTVKLKPIPKPRPTKINWPNYDEVSLMLSKSNFVQVGKKLGVSDNAVRKFLIKNCGP